MIWKFLSVGLFAVAIAVLAYGTFIEIDRQVVERNDYIFADGVFGVAALIVSSFSHCSATCSGAGQTEALPKAG